MVEMSGIKTFAYNPLCPAGELPYNAIGSTQGITNITLYDFYAATSYWGTYDSPRVGSGLGIQKGTRGGILATATQLRTRIPAIPYAVSPGECTLNVFEKYMNASGSGATVALSQITYMRSDAFVEYAYAQNNFPILPSSIISRPYMSFVDQRAMFYSPRYQKNQLIPGEALAPTITLIDGIDGATPITTGATSSTTIKILVEDAVSGPGRLELVRTSDGAFFVANISPNTTSYLYSSSDIGTLGNLTDGFYTLTAYDQAGNAAFGCFMVESTQFLVESAV